LPLEILGQGGKHNNPDIRSNWIFPQRPAYFITIHIGHHNIQKQQVWSLAFADLNGLFAIPGKEEGIPVVVGQRGRYQG